MESKHCWQSLSGEKLYNLENFEPLINDLAERIKKNNTTLAKVAVALGQTFSDMQVETFDEVFSYYKASIELEKTTIEEVEHHFMGK